MAGGITYDRVPVDNGGQIFDGLKFWVALRVPMRSSIIDQIRTNSGQVVPLERDADYLIADHARKDAPSGAISWKFITESVQSGVVQILDRYRIAQAPAGPRQASSGRPTKATRAKFTDEEDAALANWVLAHTTDRTGNQIYMQFEKTHPSHPWQSWRNRFVKKLMLLPPESLLQMAAKAADESVPQAADEQEQTQELPDPTELMLRRKGQRIQEETALQRARERTDRLNQQPTPQPAPSPQPAHQQQAANVDDIENPFAGEQFYQDLQMYCEERGIDTAPTQQVAGQPVELWELYKAVSGQGLPLDEIDWLRVAEDLAYTWLDIDAAVQALQSCYEESLAEFLEVMQEAFGDQPCEEETPTSTAATPDPTNMPTSPGEQQPSSPPARFLATKRTFDADEDADTPVPAKRRRRNRPSEIPSTPETTRRRQPTSNTDRQLCAAATPTQSGSRVPNLETRESAFDTTPSQQLQSEHLNSSPVLLHLNSVAKNSRASAGSGAPAKQGSTSSKRRLPRWGAEEQAEPPSASNDDGDGGGGGGGNGPLPSPLPPAPPIGRRPAQVVDAQRRRSKQEELDDLVQHYESLGYAHKTVVEGLKRTTMTPGLATVVMQSLHEGRGVPAHHEGIWTDRDDEGLRLVDGVGARGIDAAGLAAVGTDKAEMRRIRRARRARERLLDKHGQARMALRIKFLKTTDNLASA